MPAAALPKYVTKKRRAPSAASVGGPSQCRESMLMPRWAMPECKKAGVTKRHHSPAAIK